MRAAPAISIDDALTDRNLLGAALDDLESWSTWRVILKAAFGEPLTADELTLFKTLSGGREPPAGRVAELWVIAGRRGGKTRTAGAVGVYLASFQHAQAGTRRDGNGSACSRHRRRKPKRRLITRRVSSMPRPCCSN